MSVPGLEKFSHLEDKIYRTVELCKTLKQENEALTEQTHEYGVNCVPVRLKKNDWKRRWSACWPTATQCA
jgi:hypothetical protein